MTMFFFTCCSELGLIVFEIDPKGCAARDGRVQVRKESMEKFIFFANTRVFFFTVVDL